MSTERLHWLQGWLAVLGRELADAEGPTRTAEVLTQIEYAGGLWRAEYAEPRGMDADNPADAQPAALQSCQTARTTDAARALQSAYPDQAPAELLETIKSGRPIGSVLRFLMRVASAQQRRIEELESRK